MQNQSDTSLRIRLAGLAILALFIALAAAAYFSGRQVQRGGELIATDAVPGTINAHDMRMAMTRGVGWVMVAAFAGTTQSRDASLKIAHDADTAFTNYAREYETTIKINPAKDHALLGRLTAAYAEFHRQRMAYEGLILAGNRSGSAAFLESNLVPAYISALAPAEELVNYNHTNSITYANDIRDSAHRLYWTVAVVMVLALISAVVLVVNIATRRREIMRLRESEEKFSKAFQANPVGIAITEMGTGEYLEVNESFCRIMGHSPRELIGRAPVELGIWSTARERNQAFQSLRAGETLRDFEMRSPARDGGNRTISVSAEMIELGGKQCVVSLVQDITERKRAEQALVASAAALKEAQHLAHIGSSVWDARTDKTTWSDELYQIVGWDPALPTPAHEDRKKIYTPESFALLDRAARHALATGEPYDLQLEIIRPDGGRRQVYARGTCVRDPGGVITGLHGTLQDVTERTQLEQKQVELAAIVASSDDAIIGKSLTGTITSWNRGAEKIFGYSAAEVVGQPLLFLIPTDRHHEETAILEKIRRGEAVEHVETVRICKDGRQIYISATISPLKDRLGNVVGASKIARDITSSKQAELELKWKTAFLEAQVDSALDGILVVNDRAKRILHNRRMFQLFKVPEAIAHDDDDTKLLRHVSDRVKAPDKFRERVAHLYAHPDQVGRDEIQLVDGTILDRYSSPVRDGAGKYYGRIWVFRDITEQRALEVQYRQSQKMEAFGQLAGGVAHDFNNLLAIIQMYAGMLTTEESLSPQQLDFAGEIEKAAQRAANLTRQLLLFSRQHAMQAHDLNLNDVVVNIIKMLQRTLGAHIEIQFKMPDQPLFIRADAGMIDQILLNLTVNARDAMPRGGQILIATVPVEFDEVYAAQIPRARPGSFVCLSVADSGSGIPPEILPRIFEPFFTTKEVGKGTGLGLATVFGIVQQHQGWINVLTETGRGTTFQIYLPRLLQGPAAKSAGARFTIAPDGHETILLVEDESALRTSMCLFLTCLGYQVLEADTGPAALDLWRRHRGEISLLLTDLVMPGGITGKELADRFLADQPGLKVIYASGYSADTLSRDFILDEGVNFLIKPFTCHQLAKTIRDNLDKSG